MSDKKQYANHVIPNSFQTPNIYVDLLLELLTDSELRVLLFATRHILGWREKIKMRKGIISLEMFVNGYGPYPGCGLNKQTVIKTCKSLVAYKILEKDGITRDGTRWYLVEDFDDIEIEQLETRHANKKSNDKKRTENMLEKLKAKRFKLLCDNTPPVLCDNTSAVLCDNTESNLPSNPLSNTKDSAVPKTDGAVAFDGIELSSDGRLTDKSWQIIDAITDLDSGHDAAIDWDSKLTHEEIQHAADLAAELDSGHDDTWTKATWNDSCAFAPYCRKCNGRFKHGDNYYHRYGNGSNQLCPGCWLKLKDDDSSGEQIGKCGDHHHTGECPDYDSQASCGDCKCGASEEPQQLTTEQAKVLEYVSRVRLTHKSLNDGFFNTDAPKNKSALEALSNARYINLAKEIHGRRRYHITDTGRAALKDYKHQNLAIYCGECNGSGTVTEWEQAGGCPECGHSDRLKRSDNAKGRDSQPMVCDGCLHLHSDSDSICVGCDGTPNEQIDEPTPENMKCIVCGKLVGDEFPSDICGNCQCDHLAETDEPRKVVEMISVDGMMITLTETADEPPAVPKKPKAKKPRKTKSKKEIHPLYQKMTQAIKDAFNVNDKHAGKSDFSRIGKVANDLLDRDAKPFMIGRFYEWCNKQFDSKTLNYEILTKWYTRWRSENDVPDELPQDETPQAEEVAAPEPTGKVYTAEDCRRATAQLAEEMDMSQFDDENYED